VHHVIQRWRLGDALVQRSSDGHDSSELLKLCSVFDTDAKLEAAFHHVREPFHFLRSRAPFVMRLQRSL